MRSRKNATRPSNPTTGSVGHRRLVLDQSMIMAALDDALNRLLGDGPSRREARRPPATASVQASRQRQRAPLPPATTTTAQVATKAALTDRQHETCKAHGAVLRACVQPQEQDKR